MQRQKHVIVTGLWVGSLAALAALLIAVRPAASLPANPGTLYVAPEADCGAPSLCYTSVQAAVDAAISGDVIKVATGIYTDTHGRAAPVGYKGTSIVTQAVYISKTLTLRGGYNTTDWSHPEPDSYPTTLDAQGDGRVLFIAGDIAPTIEGLRITNGNAAGLQGGLYSSDAGGGLYISDASATISDSLVFSNTAASGGGLYLSSSRSKLISCSVVSNTAGGPGGLGGGLYLYDSRATLTGNLVQANSATGEGGGLRLHSSPAVLRANVVRENVASDGGGMHIATTIDATLNNNVIMDNLASKTGSGLFIWASSPRFLHTTIAGNAGGDGSGAYMISSDVVFTNSIVSSQTIGINVFGDNRLGVHGVLWYSTPDTVMHTGQPSISVTQQYVGNPAFDAADYHLTEDSAAIDNGIKNSLAADIDGETRPDGCYPDLGADEFYTGRVCSYMYLPVLARQSP